MTYLAEDVVVTERNELELASVMVRKRQHAALVERLWERFQIELPQGPCRTCAGRLALLGTGPGTWLAMQVTTAPSASAEPPLALTPALTEAIGDLTSVCDQSDGYAVLRLSGPNIREMLCKLVPLDLHPRAFKIGDVASTAVAHMGVTLWRLDDEATGLSVFELAFYRSFAKSFWHALSIDRS
jgi:heterotetrameric sarcosine oxidase gamma subunit